MLLQYPSVVLALLPLLFNSCWCYTQASAPDSSQNLQQRTLNVCIELPKLLLSQQCSQWWHQSLCKQCCPRGLSLC